MAELQASLQRARDRDVERETLKNELEGLSEQESALATRREELKDRLGLDALPPDAELVDFARALDQLRSARGGHEAATGKVKKLETSHAALLAELADILKRNGEPQPEGRRRGQGPSQQLGQAEYDAGDSARRRTIDHHPAEGKSRPAQSNEPPPSAASMRKRGWMTGMSRALPPCWTGCPNTVI